jgi:hypothetical protein
VRDWLEAKRAAYSTDEEGAGFEDRAWGTDRILPPSPADGLPFRQTIVIQDRSVAKISSHPIEPAGSRRGHLARVGVCRMTHRIFSPHDRVAGFAGPVMRIASNAGRVATSAPGGRHVTGKLDPLELACIA